MSTKTKKKIYKKTIINNVRKSQKEDPPNFYDILSIPSNPEDIFTLISPIGHGAFGSVYKAIHNASKKIYAIKIIQYFKDEQNLLSNINHMENINFCYKTVQEETSLMRLVNSSDYIVKYYGSYFSRQTNTLWLILEYCASGSVIDLMLAMDRTYTEIEIATIIKMVLQGLILIHNKNLIHRDIKGANILLSEEGFAKIGDFGVGVKLNQDNFRKSKKGSPYWMSPQVVLNEEYGIGTDIWSLGVTCLELINGEPPNSSLKPIEVMEKIGKRTINFEELFGEKNNYSEDFKNFVKKCLAIEEKERASANDLIKHKFIVNNAKDNKLMSELYKKHINDLEEYRKEVEEYEQELKMKQKKQIENQLFSQQQRQIQNMSIRYDSEENKEDLKYITKNDLSKTNDDELFYNKSINSLFLNNFVNNKINNSNDINNDNCEYDSSILNNNSIKYIDNISIIPNSKIPLCLSKGNIFNDNNSLTNNNNIKERYQNSCIDNIYKNSENKYITSDIVNQSSNLNKQDHLNNKSINIKEYTLDSNYSNNTNKNNLIKNKERSNKKNKIKCRIINFNKPMGRKTNKSISCLNKTMDDKRDNSYDIDKKLLLSYNKNKSINIDKDINKINKRKSVNLINNIKSLSILSNNDILENNGKNIEDIDNNILELENNSYKAIMTEDNLRDNKNTAFQNFINKSISHKQLKKNDNKKNIFNKTTDNSNTYDNSNFNTNNISNTHSYINNNSYIGPNHYLEKNKNQSFNSKILNSSNPIYTKKNYSQNIISNNEVSNNCKVILEIPVNNKCMKLFGKLNENEINNINLSNSIEEIKIKNLKCNKREKSSSFCYNTKFNEEDINDSDDDGVINNVKHIINHTKNNFKDFIKNKENINKNIINDDNKLNKSTITSRSNHSYSVIESSEFFQSIHKYNIFSNAHKKYFS